MANATLHSTETDTNPLSFESVKYGLYIDADSNIESGANGVDYDIGIIWNARERTWTRYFEELSSNGNSKPLADSCANLYRNVSLPIPETDHINMCADLNAIGSPSKYTLLFYTVESLSRPPERLPGGRIGSVYFTQISDTSSWILIPSPHPTLSTSPNTVVLRPGEQKTIDVRINESSGFDSKVRLFAQNQSAIELLNFDSPELHIPSFGGMTTPLTIRVSNTAKAGDYPLYILASSNFSRTPLFRIDTSDSEKEMNEYIESPHSENSQNITTPLVLQVTVQKPYDFNEVLNSIRDGFGSAWRDNRDILLLIIGAFITPFGAWAFTRRSKRIKKKRYNKTFECYYCDN